MTEQTQTPETENPEVQSETTQEAIASKPTIEDLQARIEELEGMLKDEQLRSLANEQNLRRRHQEEIQAAHKFAAQKFANELLTVKDYLEMALLDQSGNFDGLKMGVNMTLTELNKAFSTAQIQEIKPEPGEKFDPHRHQSQQEIITAEQEAGTIVQLIKKGYLLHDRVLRPAIVNIAKAPE